LIFKRPTFSTLELDFAVTSFLKFPEMINDGEALEIGFNYNVNLYFVNSAV
jgi:hypothetical protein